jgi:hypothetical protein
MNLNDELASHLSQLKTTMTMLQRAGLVLRLWAIPMITLQTLLLWRDVLNWVGFKTHRRFTFSSPSEAMVLFLFRPML